MPIPSSILNALIAHIREQGSYILASSEDADYFRKSFKKTETLKNCFAKDEKLGGEASFNDSPNQLPKDCSQAPKIQQQERPNTHTAPIDHAVQNLLKNQQTGKKEFLNSESDQHGISIQQSAIPNKDSKANPIQLKNDSASSSDAKSTLPPKPNPSFSQMKNLLSVAAPELAILEQIPCDQLAKRLSERWKTKNQTAPISILTYQEPGEQKILLEEIAKAIDIYFGPAKIVNAEKIEKDQQWEAFLSVEGLKMVIVCDYTLWQLANLMHFYKETPAQGSRMLGSVPLFLLPDLSLYLKDALLKRSLWKALCQKCS